MLCRSTVRRRCSSAQGITLDRSTLSAWVGRACWWLTPLYELVLGTVLSSNKLFADETTLPVLDPGRGKTKTGRLWCYAVDDRPWTGPTHPGSRLCLLPRTAEASIRPSTWRHSEACCRWMAMPASASWSKRARMPRSNWRSAGRTRRRPFYEFYTSTQSPLAAEVLARIAKLYAIEAEIRGQPPDVRQAVRQDAKSAAGRSPAASGCRITCRACRLVRSGQSHALCTAPLGRADPVSSTMAASRWTPTSSSAPSGRLPLRERTAFFAGSDVGASYCSSGDVLIKQANFAEDREISGAVDRLASASRRTASCCRSTSRIIQGAPAHSCWAGSTPLVTIR